MTNPIGTIQKTLPSLSSQPLESSGISGPPKGEGFGDLFGQFIQAVTETHNAAGDAQQALLRGDSVELHQVVIDGSKAGIATDLLLEIRNRLVDGFNEIMRMPM